MKPLNEVLTKNNENLFHIEIIFITLEIKQELTM